MYTLITYNTKGHQMLFNKGVDPEYFQWCLNKIDVSSKTLYRVVVKHEELSLYTSQIIALEKAKAKKAYEDKLAKLDAVNLTEVIV